MKRTRRDVLATAGGILFAGIAGCTGTDSEAESDDQGSTTAAFDPSESLPTPTLGADDAPVTVAVYADFACPHCQNYELETFPQLREQYIDEDVVRYEHHHLPIPVDEQWSWELPSAALGVLDTVGVAEYFEFSHTMYEHLGSYSYDTVETVAESVGADPGLVRRAAEEELYREIVETDRQNGIDAGVEATPTIFVDGSKTSHYKWSTVAEAVEIAWARSD